MKPAYRVLIHGYGVSIVSTDPDGREPPSIGYYTTVFVRGLTEGSVEYRAIARAWDDWERSGFAAIDEGRLITACEEVSEIGQARYWVETLKRFLRGGRIGRTFYSDDSDLQPHPVKRTEGERRGY